jgi:hypothetical protein
MNRVLTSLTSLAIALLGPGCGGNSNSDKSDQGSSTSAAGEIGGSGSNLPASGGDASASAGASTTAPSIGGAAGASANSPSGGSAVSQGATPGNMVPAGGSPSSGGSVATSTPTSSAGANAGAAGSAGGECKKNADCANSPAAAQLKNLRCTGQELYCLAGVCHGECLDSCSVVRSDVNPCTAPRICVPKFGGVLSVCSITPVACTTASDCPKYLPNANQAWTCDAGACAFPGFQYGTE